MNLKDQFVSFIAKENLFSPKDKLLLAASGGIDSVVLCELCHQAGYDFTIAHCNFQLRGEESERDEQFVRSLSNKYKKTVLVKKFDTNAYAAEKKVSIQVAARELRYAWFAELLQANLNEADTPITTHHSPLTTDDSRLTTQDSRLSLLLTAHHADDNIETMLMNFFKGTGIAGLRGILAKQEKIVRPLLFAIKEDIKSFAEENQLQWVEDSSNQSDKYARNYFRNQVIPLVKKLYPEVENNLVNNLQRFNDIELLYHQSIDRHKKKLVEYRGNEVHIPVLKLQKTVPLASVLYEIIKAYHFSSDQTQEVIALLNSSTGKYVQSSTHRAIKNRNWLIISPNQSTAAINVLIEEKDSEVIYEEGALSLQYNSQFPIPNSPNIACLDESNIKFPLLLRKWKEGDYFYPLGMRKKKKLARFFIDQKLSKTDKEKIWVLETDKKIIWIVGHRIDDRFKITPSTKKVLQLKLQAVNI